MLLILSDVGDRLVIHVTCSRSTTNRSRGMLLLVVRNNITGILVKDIRCVVLILSDIGH